MSLLIAPPVLPEQTTRHERRVRRRQLGRQDRLSARLAGLRTVEEILVRAEALVADGWLQDAWFAYPSTDGPRVSHLPGGLTAAAAAAADRFCLLSALHAATRPGTGARLARADRPAADRTVDTVWRTLADAHEARPLACPPPEVRALRRLELTRWNDTPGRTSGEVRSLLTRAGGVARADRDRLLGSAAVDG